MWELINSRIEEEELKKQTIKDDSINSKRLFETNIVATLSAKDMSDFAPKISCISSSLYIIVAVNNQVFVLRESKFNLVCSLNLETFADCLSLSDDSELLFIGENSGTLHVLHIATQTKLWSLPLVSKESITDYAFKSITCIHNAKDFVQICVLSYCDELYIFSNINIVELYRAIGDGSIDSIKNGIQKKNICVPVDLPGFVPKFIYENFLDHKHAVGLAGGGFTSFAADVDDDEYFDYGVSLIISCLPGVTILKAYCTRDGRHIIALNSMNYLEIICAHTFIVKKMWRKLKVMDFIVQETIDPRSFAVSDRLIGLLVQTTNDDKVEYSYEIYTFPDFHHIYGVPLNNSAAVAGCKPNQECVYIIEGRTRGSENRISSIHIKIVSESSSEARLTSLLKKHKFEEAESFAHLHKLDSQIVYKTRINCLLELLSSKVVYASNAEIDSLIKELENVLFKVKDITFIESCLSVRLPSLMQTKTFFAICRKWLDAYPEDIVRKEKLMATMNKILNKALTFEILSESNGLRSLKWTEFLLCDVKNKFTHELILGNMSTAFILWQRHHGDIISDLPIEMLEDILTSIPDSIPSNLLIPFLRDDFLPVIIAQFSQNMEKIAEWLIQRTYILETSEKQNWPENGKQLLEIFNAVCESLGEGFSVGKICFSTNLQLYTSHKLNSMILSSISRLSVLIQNLEELDILKKQYGCHLSLSEYCQEDKVSVVYFMLDRIKPSFIEAAVNKIVRSYVTKHNLTLDNCLINYIQDVLRTTPYSWWHWEEAPWEERILDIMKCIQDTDRWMEVTMTVVFQAPIPWSAGIQELVQTGLNLDHPKKEDLKTQSRLVGLKQTLLKYDLRDFQINSGEQLANALVQYILKQEKPTAFEDVKSVYHAYETEMENDVYLEQLQFLLRENRLNEMLKILSDMPRIESVICCHRLLEVVILMLNDPFLLKTSKPEIQAYAQAGVFVLRFLKSAKAPIMEEIVFLINTFIKLQKEFSMYIPIEKFSSKEFCWNVVVQAMDSFLMGTFTVNQEFQGKKSVSVKPSIMHIYRLGDIFQLKREEVMTKFIHKLADHHEYNRAIEICRELINIFPSPSSANTLMGVVSDFFGHFESMQKLGLATVIQMLYHLVNIAVTYCSESFLKMPLWEHISVLHTISQLTMRETQLASLSGITSRRYQKWKLSPLYSDEGLWVDESKVRLLIDTRFVSNRLFGSSDDGSFDSDFVNSILNLAKDVTTQMRQKGQEIAALRILMHCFSFVMPSFIQATPEDINMEALNYLTSVFEEMTFSMLQKAIDQRNPDVPFIFGSLSMLPSQNIAAAFKRLVKWASTDLTRTLTLYSVAMEFSLEYGNVDMASSFKNSYEKLSWFSKHEISIHSPQEVLAFAYPEELNMIKDTIVSRNIDLDDIFECCTIFSLDPDDVLNIYLKNLLLGNEVKQWAKCSELPQDRLNFILRRAEIVISEFNSQEVALANLKKILEEVNTYYYEILLFIHEQILKIYNKLRSSTSESFTKGVTLLQFLLLYKRVTPPTESEIDEWMSDNLMDANLPAIANHRLPFRTLMKGNVHKIINPELTVITATVWTSVAGFLQLSSDELIMIAVKNTVTKYISQKVSAVDYQAINFTPDRKFLTLLKDLLSRIGDIEKALACASWITNRMPPGANKVHAAKCAVTIARNWTQTASCEKKILDAVKKLNHLYFRLAIELTLYKYDLGVEECLALLQHPAQLIEHLLENCCIPVHRSIKVCQAIQEISDLVQLDLLSVYFGHLCRWLAPSQIMAQCADESFYVMDPTANALSSEDTDRKNMQRAICFLLGTPVSRQHELFKLLFSKFVEQSTMHKARSLCCLASVADAPFIFEITDKDDFTLREELKLLMSVSELESMRLPYSVEMFQNCNKSELVERILTSHTYNPKALITCVKICLEYQLWHSHLWRAILLRMKSLFMVDELHNVLSASSNHLPHIWHRTEFTNAWQSIISSILEKSTFEAGDGEIITNTCSALLRCPASALLDVDFIIEKLRYSNAIPAHILQEAVPNMNMSSFILLFSQSLNRKMTNESIESFFYDVEDEEEDKERVSEHDGYFPHIGL